MEKHAGPSATRNKDEKHKSGGRVGRFAQSWEAGEARVALGAWPHPAPGPCAAGSGSHSSPRGYSRPLSSRRW